MITEPRNNFRSIDFGLDKLDDISFQRKAAGFIFLVVLLRTIYLFFEAWHFSTDDAYITLRYARHFAAGEGILWNLGDAPVEGYSNFLFVLLGAVLIKLGLEPMLGIKVLSCLALLVTSALLYRIARIWLGYIGAALPMIILNAYSGTIWWTVSGLETAIYQMIVVAAVAAFFKGIGEPVLTYSSGIFRQKWSGKWLGLAGFLVFLAAITRPEGPLIGVAMGIALIFDALQCLVKCRNTGGHRATSELIVRAGKMAAVLVLCFALPYLLYFFWRYGYFGRLFPNTVYCKASYMGDPMVLIRAFWFMVWPACLLGVFAFWRPFDGRLLALFLIVIFYVLLLYGVDPIIGYLNRHFMVAYALLLIPASIGLLWLAGQLFKQAPKSLQEFVIVVLLLGFTCYSSLSYATWLSTKAGLYEQRMAARSELARWLNANLSPSDTFVLGDVGIVSYIARANILDAYCLNCAAMTTPPISRSSRKLVDYMLQKRPEMIVVHSKHFKQLDPRTAYDIYPQLLGQDAFLEGYKHARTFGSGGFNYWVFERLDR